MKNCKVLIIDGQGGGIGKQLTQIIKENFKRFQYGGLPDIIWANKGSQIIKINSGWLFITSEVINCHFFEFHFFLLVVCIKN